MQHAASSPATDLAHSVELHGVTKRYLLFDRRRDRALALLGWTKHLASMTAVHEVDLEILPGEAVGIIGENGSGKSTLLRLVAGISTPDAGTIRVVPPVAAILELGLGFHPEFTGRENAVLYGSLLGLQERLVAERLDDVLAFAELGESIDRPLRTYSSGMTARLAFAVATNVDPQVLVVDEALAVGDGAFQKKCVDRMVRFKEEGRTVLFCSHSMYLVAGFCERALWLHQGKVAGQGPARDVIHAYEDYLRHRGQRTAEAPAESHVSAGQLAWVQDVRVEPAGGSVVPGDPVAVHVRLRRRVSGVPLHVAVAFEDENGVVLVVFATHWDGHPPLSNEDEEEITLRVPSSPFVRGPLNVTVYLGDETGLQVVDLVLVRRALTILARQWEPGLVRVAHTWETGPWRG